ncbi:hypothetical protein KI659_16655 [Litoribacter alkaliphilus]|uniref:Secreted protein n=1 Tax=Litoribacter ruber TaxID=702568 RepID=A0AAP2G632_9BACT|nr:hypothetical protein [Litoribacter alkaliphilus]MBS9525651.1 hypothetical protein [Litoribacter alkaliphilus]
MKNSVKNLLRGGVFALAAVFAFAFTQPKVQGYATMDGGNTWIDTSDPEVNYRCISNPSDVCIYEAPDLESDVVEHGTFQLL